MYVVELVPTSAPFAPSLSAKHMHLSVPLVWRARTAADTALARAGAAAASAKRMVAVGCVV